VIDMAAIELSEFMRQQQAKQDKFEHDYDYISVSEYAEKHEISTATVRRYANEGRLEYITIGKKKLIKIRRDCNGEKLLEENRALREENAALKERLSNIKLLVMAE